MKMEERINIAELLKDCPRGMELDCLMFNNVTFGRVDYNRKQFPIEIVVGGLHTKYLTKEGCFHDTTHLPESKCIIFPKGKNTWEGFQRPFKDGDIISDNRFNAICIFKGEGNIKGTVDFYCGVSGISKTCGGDEFFIKDNKNQNWHFGDIDGYSFATKEEKQKLFNAIQDNGYKWNTETKTLEKLIIPKFKVGDIITNGKTFIAIGYIDDEYYYEISRDIAHKLCIKNQDEWELVPNKFNVNTLKTFDQILVRLTNNCVWIPKFFSHLDNKNVKYCPFVTTDNVGYPQCVPYKGNEHLCRTTNNCDEFYRVWEK